MSPKKTTLPALPAVWTLPAEKATTHLYLDPTGRPLVSLPAAPVGSTRYYVYSADAAPDLAAPMTAHQYENVAHVARARKAAPVLQADGEKWVCAGFRFPNLAAPDLPATMPPACPLAPAFFVTLPAADLAGLMAAAAPDKLVEEREYAQTETRGTWHRIAYLAADVANGRLALASFDGYRIHAQYIPDDYTGAALADDIRARFPLAAVRLALKAAGRAGEVTLTAGDAAGAAGCWRIDAGSLVMFGAWETAGPDWQAIIPKDGGQVMFPAPDPAEFQTFLAAAAACGGKAAPLHLRADGAAWVYNPETCPDAFCAGFFPDGAAPYTEREKGAVAVNVTYYTAAVEWAGSMTLYGLFPNTPLRLQSADGGRLAVVMPMRIDR